MFSAWSNVRRDLADACAKLGIEPVTPNDLRRTLGTWLRADGVEPQLIGAMMGHADSRMVERVYGRLPTDALGKLIAARYVSGGAVATGTDEASSDTSDQPETAGSECPETESNRRHGDFQSSQNIELFSGETRTTGEACSECVESPSEEPPSRADGADEGFRKAQASPENSGVDADSGGGVPEVAEPDPEWPQPAWWPRNCRCSIGRVNPACPACSPPKTSPDAAAPQIAGTPHPAASGGRLSFDGISLGGMTLLPCARMAVDEFALPDPACRCIHCAPRNALAAIHGPVGVIRHA